MKILFLSQLVPYPPDSGPKVRSYFTLRHLAKQNEVTLLAFSRPDDSPASIEHLRSFCRAVHTIPINRSTARDGLEFLLSVLQKQSFIIRRDEVPAMKSKVEELTKNTHFDFIHADQLWMAQYAIGAKEAARGPRLLLDEHNACYQIFQRLADEEQNPLKRMIYRREWPALKRYEAWACRQFDQLVTVTNQDRKTLESLVHETYPNSETLDIQVIPICVDTEILQMVTPNPDASDVLHMGTMFWMPNVEGVAWFIERVWPLLKKRVPTASFSVVGKRPPDKLHQLAENDETIQIHGYAADPTPYLQKCAAFIVPLRSGSGMRVKIVEAWARGLPIVSTTVGAEGLAYIDGENILIADEEEIFAETVGRLLSDLDLNQKLRENGRRWVEQKYDWRRVYQDWDTVYQKAQGIRASSMITK